MPVSSPSYFPPARGTDQIIGLTAGQGQTGARAFMAGQSAGKFTKQSDLILIGDNVMSSGTIAVPNTDLNGNGAIVIGSGAGAALKTFTGAVNAPVTILGTQAAALATTIPGSTIMGYQALASMTNAGNGSVRTLTLIGQQVLQNATDAGAVPLTSSVVIGYQAMQGNGTPNKISVISTVVIGSSALAGTPTNQIGSISSSVFIGESVCPSISNCAANVVIGQGSGSSASTGWSNNTIVGQGNNFQTPSGCIVLGRGNTIGGSTANNIFVGNGVGTPTGNRNILIGLAAGTATVLTSDQAIMESYDGITRRTAFFSDMSTGCIVIGNGVRNIVLSPNGALNCLFLPNGAPSGTASIPTGGYFYVDPATGLHFVGSAGTNTTLAPL